MLVKARAIDVDEVVIDLEDAVLPAHKEGALESAIGALREGGFRAPRLAVRCNPLASERGARELAALTDAPRPPDSVVVPKVERVADVPEGLPAQALVETAAGLLNLREIAMSPGLEALIVGYADLAASLGRSLRGAASLDRWLAIQDAVLVAARAAGLRAIDGPFLAIGDEPGLRAASDRAAELGFDGKWAIHPSQVRPIREAFAPTEEELARARAVVDALERAADGAVSLDGEMVDEPVRLAALRTLSRAGRER